MAGQSVINFKEVIEDARTLPVAEWNAKYKITEDFAGAMEYTSVPPGGTISPAQRDSQRTAPDIEIDTTDFQAWMRCFILGMQEAYQPLDPNAQPEARPKEFPSCKLRLRREIKLPESESGTAPKEETTAVASYSSDDNTIYVYIAAMLRSLRRGNLNTDEKVPRRFFSPCEHAYSMGFEETLHSIFVNREENKERYAGYEQQNGMSLEYYKNDPREQDIVAPKQALVIRMQLGFGGDDLYSLSITGGTHHSEGELNQLSPSSFSPTKAPPSNQRSQDTSTSMPDLTGMSPARVEETMRAYFAGQKNGPGEQKIK